MIAAASSTEAGLDGPHATSTVRPLDALGVFGLALCMRVWHVLALRRSPFFDVLMGDSLAYDEWARRLAAGDWIGGEVFYQAPLYPYFLGVLYALVSDDLLFVRLAHALLGSLACLLLALAAGRFAQSRVAGIAAGAILALYAPAIFHDGLVGKSTLDLFWLCGLLWCLSRTQDDPRSLLSWAAGASLGALTLTRENAGVLLLPIAVWLWFQFRGSGRRVALIAALLAGIATVLLPVALRNYSIDGGFNLTTSQLGSNLYYGNHAGADGTYQAFRFARGGARSESADATSLAQAALGRELDPAEVSDYWTGKVLDYIQSQPLEWLSLMGRKLLLLLNAAEMVDTEDQYTYAKWSPVLRVSGALLHFGVIAPLAVVGVFATWKRRERFWLLYLMAPTYAASVLAFYVLARYRLPLVPFVAIGAGAAIASAGEFPAKLRNLAAVQGMPRTPWGRLVGAATTATAVILAALVCNWPLVDRTGMGAANYYNLGVALYGKGDHAAALGHYQSAIEIAPEFSAAHWAAGVSLASRGELQQAIASYRAAIALRPDVASIHHSLADALAKTGNIEGSILHYQESLRLEPDDAQAHFYLAVGFASSGREAEGRGHARRAVELDPSLLARLSEVAWHRATRQGVGTRRSPDGRFALQLARWAARLTDPATPHSLDVLAASYAAAGRFATAARIAREAIDLAQQAGNGPLTSVLHQRLVLYEQGRPFVPGGR